MENKLIIKKANLTNLQEIIDIENDLDNRILSNTVLEDELDNDKFLYLIAYLNDTPIGYLSCSLCVDHADLNSIVIIEDYRNNGYAFELLKHAIVECKKNNLDNMFLEVRDSNLAAIKVYEKAGFKIISRRKRYYSKPTEDALIYVKTLNSPHNL